MNNNNPINTREKLTTDEDELQALSEKEIEIKKKIGKISSLLSIELTYGDKQSIIDYINLINHQELIDVRYDESDYTKKHPIYGDIKTKYPIVQIKKKEDALKNKKNKELREKEYTEFNEYLIDCNELFIITFLILFHIQTSNPPYSIKTKENKDHERKRVILLLLLFSIQQGLSNDISIQFAAQITRCT